MKITLHYLNWDRKGTEELIAYFALGYKGRRFMLEPSCYRTETYSLPRLTRDEDTLQRIYEDFNDDERRFVTNERSLCVGDIIEIHGEGLFAVEPIGFARIMKSNKHLRIV